MNNIDINKVKPKLELLASRLARCKGDINLISYECKAFMELAKNSKYKEMNDFENIINEVENIMASRYVDQNLTMSQINKIIEIEILNRYMEVYDKSKKVNSNMLDTITTSKGQKFKAVRYIPKEEPVIIYKDDKITIESIGTLNFKHFTRLADYITKYRVKKEDNSYEVYSSIIVPEMEKDELYKQAVLDVLLGDNNIKFSNCNGYIGSIEQSKSTNRADYIINDKYCLMSDSTEATAVYEYEKMNKSLQEKNVEENNVDLER